MMVWESHRKQNTMWKRFFFEIINCTIAPLLYRLSKCSSFYLQVPCSLYLIFVSFFWSYCFLCKARNKKMEALVYCYCLGFFIFSTSAPTDGKRQLHILLSKFWGLFSVHWTVPEVCRDVDILIVSLRPEMPLCKYRMRYKCTSLWSKGLEKVGSRKDEELEWDAALETAEVQHITALFRLLF